MSKDIHYKYAEVLRHTTYKHIDWSMSDGKDGRCSLGVLMSFMGWDGKKDTPEYEEYKNRLLNEIGYNAFYGILDADDNEKLSFSEIADLLERCPTIVDEEFAQKQKQD